MIGLLAFEPAFKSMLWGGTRLRPMFGAPLSDEATGEAWVLSDVDGTESVVAHGPWQGQTLRTLLNRHGEEILGPVPRIHGRFPLLLKFIDAKQTLSVQVHPNDRQAAERHPGQNGKTEAWVILDADPQNSLIYSGLIPGTTSASLRQAIDTGTVAQHIATYRPHPGDCFFLEAGTVHAIGAETLLFEVQQTSDLTYRLYDWDRVDPKTGRKRELHLEAGLACTSYSRGPNPPVKPSGIGIRERLIDCPYFTLNRIRSDSPVTLGQPNRPTAIVALSGRGQLNEVPVKTGSVLLVPAAMGQATLSPEEPMTVLECGLVVP